MRKKIIPLHFFQTGIFASLIAIMAFANATPSAATGETDTPSADAGATETSVFGTVYAEIFATQTAARCITLRSFECNMLFAWVPLAILTTAARVPLLKLC